MVVIHVKNFQSIADEVIHVDGFSAVAGKSNLGKSAFIRAVKAALTGAPVDSYVRHNPSCPRVEKGAKSCKCFCSVHIKGDGLDLLWEKGDAVNRYVYNGTTYTVVGRGTPDFLTDAFTPVKIGDDKELIQISDQFNPIFILNKTGTVVADVLSDVAKLDQINTAIRLAEKDRKEAASTRKVREKDVADLRRRLTSYDGLDAVVSRVADVENLERQVEEEKTKVAKLERFIETLLGVVKRIKSLENVTKLTVPEIGTAVDLGLNFSRLNTFSQELRLKESAVASLEGVGAVSTPNIEDFVRLSGSYRKLVQWTGRVETLKAFFERAQKTTSVVLPSLDALQKSQAKHSLLAAWAGKSYNIAQSMADMKKALTAVLEQEAAVKAEFEALGVCPTCNREFTEAHPHA